MPYEMMRVRLPELAVKETRSIKVPLGNIYNLPPDEYGLLEMYCNEEDCDCRRVFLDVVARSTGKSVAFIAYGWESFNYYARWYLGEDVDVDEISLFDREDVVKIMGPYLNDLSPQSEIAPAVLKMVAEQALNDKKYVDRLKRHYKLFRNEVDKYYKELEDDAIDAPLLSDEQDLEYLQHRESANPLPAKREKKDEMAIHAQMLKSKIPEKMATRYEEIAGIISDFCYEKLDDEFEELCFRALTKLCRKRPSPIVSGNINTWACGIFYAIGSNNFIFDKSQPHYMPAAEIADWFGISKSTAGNKATQINKLLDISYFNIDYLLKRYVASNPAIWYVSYNGYIVDIRNMPRELQEEAYRQGVIPYVPDDEDE